MIFDFIKKAGERLVDNTGLGKAIDHFKDKPEHASEEIKKRVKKNDLNIENLNAEIKGDKVIMKGNAKNAEEAEKAILVAGNIEGVAQVESNLNIQQEEPQSEFYTVQSGDTLSKIAKNYYGDSNQYMKIFEANKPMLSDPDKIYPGQSLRIPAANKETRVA